MAGGPSCAWRLPSAISTQVGDGFFSEIPFESAKNFITTTSHSHHLIIGAAGEDEE